MRWVNTANLPEERRSRRGQRDKSSDPEQLHHREQPLISQMRRSCLSLKIPLL